MHLFKGLWDTFEKKQMKFWGYRDTKVPGVLGYLLKMLYDLRSIGLGQKCNLSNNVQFS